MRAVRRLCLSLVVGGALAMSLLGSCLAADGEVRVGGRVLMRFVDDGKVSGQARAALVKRQVEAALRRHLPLAKLRLVPMGSSLVLAWGDVRVCTVDARQADSNHSTVRELGESWMRNLRGLLTEGYLTVAPRRVVMPVGETRRVRVDGLVKGPIQARADGRGLQVSTGDDVLVLKGEQAGTWRVDVVRDGLKVSLPVVVKEWAGVVPDRVYFSVTGRPAGRDLLQMAALQAARRAVQVQPGAAVTLKAAADVPESLSTGSDVVVRLPLLVEGKDYWPVDKSLEVVIRNENVDLARPALLMVSNRPEKVDHEGVLFRSTFAAAQPTRLLYSHVNGASADQYLWVNVTNRGDKPARLLVVQADGGPAREELYVGHRCNTRFLEGLASSQGLIITIPPQRTWELARYEMAADQLVSGLCQLQTLEGGDLEVTVETSSRGFQVAGDRLIDSPFNPFRIHPKGVFSDPTIVVDSTFVVGSSESTEIPFGRAPWLIDGTTGEPNTGNYGVLYELRLEVSNPTQEYRKVSLFFEPVNGVALGSFLVEGKLTETNCLKPPARALIRTVELAPQENRSIRIVTLPQAGSHYPARILIQSPTQETHRESGGT